MIRNERFRALVQTRHDENYCTAYTTSEKRAIAEEILKHIKSLDPPGRFLKRMGRAPTSRGLNGPWEELSDREAIKKTCQALRDCNRADRSGYAAQVNMPEDVRRHAESRSSSGLTNKQQAANAAAQKSRDEAGSVMGSVPLAAMPSRPYPGHYAGGQHTPLLAAPGPVSMPYPSPAVHGLVPIQISLPMQMQVPSHPMPLRPDLNNATQTFAPSPMPLCPPSFLQTQMHGQHHVHTEAQTPSLGHTKEARSQDERRASPHNLDLQRPCQLQESQHQTGDQRHQFRQENKRQKVFTHTGENPLKRRRTSFEAACSPPSSNGHHSEEWSQSTRAHGSETNGLGQTFPMNGANYSVFTESLVSAYGNGVETKTPSQETHTTIRTTPTTGGTSAGRSLMSNRTSLSSTALPGSSNVSPNLAYDPHHIVASASFYAHHPDFIAPPSPTREEHLFAFPHEDPEHGAVCSAPSPEIKHSYHNEESLEEQQQFQAAAAAAAAAMSNSEEHNENETGYRSSSPELYNSEDDTHSLML